MWPSRGKLCWQPKKYKHDQWTWQPKWNAKLLANVPQAFHGWVGVGGWGGGADPCWFPRLWKLEVWPGALCNFPSRGCGGCGSDGEPSCPHQKPLLESEHWVAGLYLSLPHIPMIRSQEKWADLSKHGCPDPVTEWGLLEADIDQNKPCKVLWWANRITFSKYSLLKLNLFLKGDHGDGYTTL